MAEIIRATFDGIRFSLYDENGDQVASEFAVSGKPLAQNPKFQGVQDFGPLPEGEWIISTAEPSFFRLGDYEIQIRGDEKWYEGWGDFRVALRPMSGTETHGRGDFYLHGSRSGNGYGSAGCIDLNLKDRDIFDLIREHGASSIVITVNYDDQLATSFHPVFAGRADIEALLDFIEAGDQVGEKNWNGVPRDQLLERVFNSIGTRCFPADTHIQTSRTTSTAISALRVGDVVLAFDARADKGRGALVPRRVTRLYRNTTTDWLRLRWFDGTARGMASQGIKRPEPLVCIASLARFHRRHQAQASAIPPRIWFTRQQGTEIPTPLCAITHHKHASTVKRS